MAANRQREENTMNSEFHALTVAQQTAVRAAIQQCQRTKARATINTADGGETYAYPHSGGSIAWGFNRADDGFNVARGVMEG